MFREQTHSWLSLMEDLYTTGWCHLIAVTPYILDILDIQKMCCKWNVQLENQWSLMLPFDHSSSTEANAHE